MSEKLSQEEMQERAYRAITPWERSYWDDWTDKYNEQDWEILWGVELPNNAGSLTHEQGETTSSGADN